jgi:hypothetical protein
VSTQHANNAKMMIESAGVAQDHRGGQWLVNGPVFLTVRWVDRSASLLLFLVPFILTIVFCRQAAQRTSSSSYSPPPRTAARPFRF